MRPSRIFACVGLVVGTAGACATFAASGDETPAGPDGGDGQTGDDAPSAADASGVDPCDLPDASAPPATGCGDTNISDSNCGVCGHSCLPSTCAGGTCTVEYFSATGPPSIAIAGVVDGWLYGASGLAAVRLRADNLASPVETILTIPQDAGTQIGILAATPDGLVGGVDYAYVFSAALDGSGFATTGEGAHFYGVARTADEVFWTAGATPLVAHATTTGGDAKPYLDETSGVATELRTSNGQLFALDNAHYGDADAGTGDDGFVFAKTIDGGNGMKSAPTGSPAALLVHRDYVYWFDTWRRLVMRAPRAAIDTAPTVIARLPEETPIFSGAAIDDANIYILLTGDLVSVSLWQVSRCGHGNIAPRKIAQQLFPSGNVVVDDRFLYWSTAGRLTRMVK
jgi:hypothetical protein